MEKTANTCNTNFSKNGLGEQYQHSVFRFLGIVVPYKCAKFGADCFRNGGAKTFFVFLSLWKQLLQSIYIKTDEKTQEVQSK